MQSSSLLRLREAIEDGEALTIIYSGGHSPGKKRKVFPIRIAGHLLYARSMATMQTKTYLLDGVSVVEEGFPVDWAVETTVRQRATRVDPNDYFSKWAYKVDRALWPALGVTLREYVDKEKSAIARATEKSRVDGATQQGLPTLRYMAYAIGNPPQLDFHEGDLFLPKEPIAPSIQVVARRKLLEVHQITQDSSHPRIAFQLVETELCDWLRDGVTPIHARVEASQSFSDVLRFGINSGVHAGIHGQQSDS